MNKKNMSKGLTIIVWMLAILVIMTGCAQTAQVEEPIKIGWIGPLSGPSAVLGIDSVVAAQLAVDEINAKGGIKGQQVELLVQDDQYNIAKATDAYNKLVYIDGVEYVLLHTFGSVYALADQAKEDNVIIIEPIDCNDDIAKLSSAVFCLATDSESIADVLVEQVQGSSIGIIHWNSDLFMPLIASYIEEKHTGDVVSQSYVAGTQDFKTIIAQMQNEGIENLVLLGYDETGNAMKQARELRFDGNFYTTATITSPSLQAAAAGAAENAVFAYWEAPKSESFLNAFIAVQGRPPLLDLAAYPTYDSVYALAAAIENNQNDVALVLQEVVFDGITGNVAFDENGAVKIPESGYILQDGAPVALS